METVVVHISLPSWKVSYGADYKFSLLKCWLGKIEEFMPKVDVVVNPVSKSDSLYELEGPQDQKVAFFIMGELENLLELSEQEVPS